MHQPPRMDPVEPLGWRPKGWAWFTGSRTLLHCGFLLRRLTSWDCRSSQEMKHFFPPSLRFTDLSPSTNVHTHTPVPRCGVDQGWKAAHRLGRSKAARPTVGLLESGFGAHGCSLPPTNGLACSQPFATLSRHVSPAGQCAQVPSVPPYTVKGDTS